MAQNTPEQQAIKKLIKEGEGLTVEFKKCNNMLNRDVYETVCAFMNRHGGTLLLGVKDSGEITGVEKEAINQIRKDFVNTINNPQKINPPTYLSIEEVDYLLNVADILGKLLFSEAGLVYSNRGDLLSRNFIA